MGFLTLHQFSIYSNPDLFWSKQDIRGICIINNKHTYTYPPQEGYFCTRMFWSREVGWTRNSSASMIFGQLITVLIALRLGEKSQPSILIFNSFPHQEARHVWTKSWDILFHCPDFYFLACRCKDHLTGTV